MGLGPFDTEIFPHVFVLTQFDPATVEAAEEYDDVFREPVLTDGDGDGVGEKPSGLHAAEVKVPGQLESSSLEALSMNSGGNLPGSDILVSFSRGRLTELGMMRSDGRPTIKPNDRLVRMEDMDENTLWTFDRPPGGLYCNQVRMADAPLGERNNWFIATFSARKGKQGPMT